jgi:hypothetical protein
MTARPPIHHAKKSLASRGPSTHDAKQPFLVRSARTQQQRYGAGPSTDLTAIHILFCNDEVSSHFYNAIWVSPRSTPDGMDH